jgi:hypothetical protein
MRIRKNILSRTKIKKKTGIKERELARERNQEEAHEDKRGRKDIET